MRRKLAAALTALILSLLTAPAQADQRAFSAGSLIIPMDACYQAALDTMWPSYCVNGKTPDDGIIKAYGMVYLLLRKGITVYMSINPAKTAIDGVDMSLTRSGGGTPVGTYNRASRTFSNFTTATTVSYRGAPFIIDVSDAQKVLDLLASDPVLSTASFSTVAIHIAYDNFVAPIQMRMNGVPPKVAVFVPDAGEGGSNGTEGIPLMRAYLRRAGLDYTGAIGTRTAPGEIFDMLSVDDVKAGALTSSYQVVWFPHYDLGTGDSGVLTRTRDFADAGGMIFAECASIKTFEGNSVTRFMTTAGASLNALPNCYPGNVPGFNRRNQPVTSYTACWDPKPTLQNTTGANVVFLQPANPFVQIGDFRFYLNSGAVKDWKPASGSAWRPGVVPLLRSSDTAVSSQNNAVIIQSAYKDNDTNKGQIIYFGGHFYGDSTAQMTSGVRIVLNTLMFAKPTLSTRYLTRSGPSLMTVGSRLLLFQGAFLESNAELATFNSALDSSWPFPQVLGQFRAYDTAALTIGTQSLAADDGGIWNAVNLIPSASTRRVLTTIGTGATPTITPLTSTNLTSLGANPFGLPLGSVLADATALLNKIRGAQLGGIDRSTAAVVGPQAVVPGGKTRPTVAYVGARDGMLHAFMVDGNAATPGTELWALLPGDQLPLVRQNGAAIDASPTVTDIYESIGGVRKWRTLLTVSQGRNGTMLYGLDVSDPLNPSMLWRRGTTSTGLVLGTSQSAVYTTCPTSSNPFQSFVILASSRVGTGSGVTVTALSGADGSQLWRWSTTYTRVLPGTTAIVPNDTPAPVALGDTDTKSSCEDRVYVVDLEGKIWELETTTGQNVNGTDPLADVGLTPSNRVQPIGAPAALYVNKATGQRMMAVVTGGADWAYAADTYALYNYNIDKAARLTTTTSGGRAPLVRRVPLATGQRGYAAPTVSGDDVYVLSSSGTMSGSIAATIADSATLSRINLKTGQVTYSQSLTKGAGAFVATADGTIYGTTSRDVVRIQATGADRDGKAMRDTYKKPMKKRMQLEMP